jgi:TM2 domain-containing membrane protein YozV
LVKEGYGKNPVIAAILSFFIPGLGQVYNGEGFLKGLIYLIATLIGYLLLVLPGLVIWLYGIYNAYSTAKKVNEGILPYKNVSAGTMIIFAVLGFVAVIVWIALFTIILAAVIAAFLIPIGGSVSGY